MTTQDVSGLLELAEIFVRPKTRNPWPENSDYGKLWRKGYQAGRSDANLGNIAAALRARASTDRKEG